ncbi:hypothetical protein DYH09_09755 [bacterium CPR1]|nr:hypothetical protein [bacterium CPR1]
MNVTTAQVPANPWNPQGYQTQGPAQGAPQPTDGYVPSGRPATVDLISRGTAVGATALLLAYAAGASEGVLGLLGLPVALGGVAAVALTFASKDGSFSALKDKGMLDKSARVAAFSALASGLASAAGMGDGITGLLALPLLVAGPVATFLWAKEAMNGRNQGGQPQQPPTQLQPPTPGQTWQAPTTRPAQAPTNWGQAQGQLVAPGPVATPPVQFGSNTPSPTQFGAVPTAPVQFGSNQPAPQQQQAQEGDGQPPAPPNWAQR